MKPHDAMIAAWKEDPAFRKEYDPLEEEFVLFDALVSARHQAGLSQADVAERMGTQTPAIARLEAGGGRQRHSPSLATLRKYAAAVGCRLEIKLVPLSLSSTVLQENDPGFLSPGKPSTTVVVSRNPLIL